MLKFIFSLLILFLLNIYAKDFNTIILTTTTSVYDTGLLDVIIPIFEEKSGFKVKIIATGTGQALKMASRGEVDIILVHEPQQEEKFINEGYGINRKPIMYNNFVIVGPENDIADVKNATNPIDAFKRIAKAKTFFISRGDESGTHIKEKKLWKDAGITPDKEYYIESGTGMATTLQIANQKNAYTLCDISTFFALEKTISLKILFQDEKNLLNIYHIIEVNPKRFSTVNNLGARVLSDFLISNECQKIIKEFGIKKFGKSLFIPYNK
jgi:tungstate transport system substrate-binding protein